MSTSSSATVRSRSPVLQKRDRLIFHKLFIHRYLTIKHVHELAFAGRSLRMAQDRLRRLWKAGYLERTRTVREDWQRRDKHPPVEFLYALAKRGAECLAAESGEVLTNIPHTPEQNAQGFTTLQHHLVVTDALIALDVATTSEPARCELIGVEREHVLRHNLGMHAMNTEVPRPWLIPDGAFDLYVPDVAYPVTFYLEVVRSLPVGGRQAFFEKIAAYIDALREEKLQQIWNHPHVAAVLVLAPTAEKAERLRVQAERLPRHADRFWFAPYLTADAQGNKHNALTVDTILTSMWRDGQGRERSLLYPSPNPHV